MTGVLLPGYRCLHDGVYRGMVAEAMTGASSKQNAQSAGAAGNAKQYGRQGLRTGQDSGVHDVEYEVWLKRMKRKKRYGAWQPASW
jgi:hypothetical protein